MWSARWCPAMPWPQSGVQSGTSSPSQKRQPLRWTCPPLLSSPTLPCEVKISKSFTSCFGRLFYLSNFFTSCKTEGKVNWRKYADYNFTFTVPLYNHHWVEVHDSEAKGKLNIVQNFTNKIPKFKRSQVKWFYVSGKDASWMPPYGVDLSMSDWEETLRRTQDTLERLYLSADLGTPWSPPRKAGRGGWGKSFLNLPDQAAASETWQVGGCLSNVLLYSVLFVHFLPLSQGQVKGAAA